MATRYYARNDSGNTELPVTDGTYLTRDMNIEFETGVLVVAFYDSEDKIVTPTAGTIDHAMSPIDGQWQSSSSGTTPINAMNCGPDATYEVPTYVGPAIKGRIELTGVTGADYCVAYFWRA
ncbi:hypothetical protein NVP1076O_29 [Vibrio phage 1.076.O._10N.286.51.B7]|nr:hypothetical protein NVP1076O_29 [Vibrio phage 1.076.O._10N.286.51.B7]